MKKTIALLFTLFAVAVYANTKNETAYELEKAYKNIADTMATEHLTNGACDLAYTADIANASKKAREYFDWNNDYNKAKDRKFSLSDNVKNVLSTTLVLREVMNTIDDRDPMSYAKALDGVTMWGAANGAFGNQSYLKFGKNGQLTKGLLIIDHDIEDGFKTRWVTSEASFDVQKQARGQVVIYTIDENNDEKAFLLKQSDYPEMQWILVPKDQTDANPHMNGYTDYPSECEA